MENRQNTRQAARDMMEDNAVLLTPANDLGSEDGSVSGEDASIDLEAEADGEVDASAEVIKESVNDAEAEKEVDASTAKESVNEASIEGLGPQELLGRYLSDTRESMQMGIDEIARTTKIPKTSLSSLESGEFHKLPGDVFVRGFLRSYARCLKLDGDDVIRRYAECGLCPAPVSSEMADTLLAPNQKKARSFPTALDAKQEDEVAAKSPTKPSTSPKKTVKKVLRDAFDLARPASKQTDISSVAKASKGRKIEVIDLAQEGQVAVGTTEVSTTGLSAEAKTETRVRVFVPPALDFGDDISRRGPLTLGVIILVIVATLTMSYLLRRPGTSAEGFTQAPQAPDLMGPDSNKSSLIDSYTTTA